MEDSIIDTIIRWGMGFGFLGVVVLFFFFPTVFFLIIKTGKALIMGFLISLVVIAVFCILVGIPLP